MAIEVSAYCVKLVGAICKLIAEFDEFQCCYFNGIAFRTNLVARNVKLIGDSLKLTGKTFIMNLRFLLMKSKNISLLY